MNTIKDGKITLGMIKGKSMNTSLPSIAVRFDASSEKLEELFQSSVDSKKKQEEVKNRNTEAVGESGSSPIHTSLNYTNRHSGSTETGLAGHDLSPPSDRWKFFTDIKGKITKSVEDTITEIKLRNQDNETSSKKFKHSKDKDNCSLSDSDDMSESSISKTTEVISNTEGVEMSSDEETPSLEKDKTLPRKSPSDITQPTTLPLQQHKSSTKKKPNRDNNISVTALASIYEINTGLKATTFKGSSLQRNENFEVESGVEAFEDTSFHNSSNVNNAKSDMTTLLESPGPNYLEKTDEEIVSHIVETIDNISLEDEKVLNIRSVVGAEIRDSFLTEDADHTYLAPQGFVDLRDDGNETSWIEIIYSYRNIFAITGALVIYFCITVPVYLTGFIAGILFTLAIMNAYNKFFVCNVKETSFTDSFQTILEIPAAKEYQPLRRFEGWMNEFPGVYDPENYHICQTQSVYVRLQGNLLKISHTRSKIPKRSMWNEPKHKSNFTHHRIYNLLGAKVMLLPQSLNRKRLWSKKYPICIILSKDQLNFNMDSDSKSLARDESQTSKVGVVDAVSEKTKKESGHKKKYVAQIWELNLLAFLSLRYLIVFLLLIHWTACMHYAVPYFVASVGKMERLDPDSWIMAAHIDTNTSVLDTYVQCVFRACCYLLCIGHGKNPVNTAEDYIMGILTLVIGYLFLAVLLVLTLQIVSSVTSAETKYQEIMNQVKEYMGYKQLPSTMQERLISYYEYRFRKSYFREDIISGALSERLRREINVHCYRKLVDSVSIFKDMHHHTVADIVNSLKSEIFLPNDIIVKAGSIGDCMYFLSSGTVCVVTPTGKEPQVFSKLTEEDEEEELDNESAVSRISTPPSSDEISQPIVEDSLDEDVSDILKDIFESDEDQGEDDTLSLDEWGIVIQEESMTETCIYLFARSHREKEEWYQRFLMGTHKGAHLRSTDNLDMESQSRISDTLLNYFNYEEEYLRYMARFQKVLPFILLRRNLGNAQQSNKKQMLNNVTEEETEQAASVLWINALVGRIVFDCQRNLAFSKLVVERIQRKLSSIKLPYFIEQITVSELSLGTTPFLIHTINSPTLDQRGLWIDLDMTYDGSIILTVQTKLNLMKLKQPPVLDENKLNRSANWQSSDVDDTAESSTDDEAKFISVTNKVSEDPSVATSTSFPINKSNKLFKMVDKIAESKFFQAAAENRYVKKALEGVSNTELGLKVELKGLVGTIVLNIPPPPSDRIWFGFRPIPKLWLSAQPMVGERHIPIWKQISNWIEKKLIKEFQKVLVLPNMEDILIPAMSSTLPEQTM